MTTMLCPVCRNVDLVTTDRQGIDIDGCPTGQGFEDSDFGHRDHGRGHQGHQGKRRSLWRELFD